MTGASPQSARREQRAAVAWRVLRRLIDVRPEEARVLFWCWLYIFAVLSSYYIMRPIRDQMGVAGGVHNLQWLFTGTLIGMVVVNLPFAYLVKTLPRRRFIPLTYRFFALNILLFAAALYLADPAQTVWVGRAFFIWVSVYNLFVVSIFWQLNVDLFSPEQGKRLFGFIAAGATLGAICGSALTASLARFVPPMLLLLGAAVLLEVAIFAVGRLSRLSPALSHRPDDRDEEQPLGGSVVAGITHALRSPYLVNVSLFILLFAISATFLYFQQAGIVSRSFSDRGAQTAFFATIDLLVNVLTLGVQLFLTGRILAWFGVAVALSFLPLLTALGFGALAWAPTLSAIAIFQVLRRAGDYAIARPTREVLFTVIPREDRYKAKSFIDTFVYRLGDQLGAWSVAGLRWLGAGAAELALVAIPIALLWLLNALWLGRRQEERSEAQDVGEGQAPVVNSNDRRQKDILKMNKLAAITTGGAQAAFGIAYLVLGLFQMAALVGGLEDWLGLHWLLALILSFPLSYFPIIGTILGIFGAHTSWGWSWGLSIALFFGPLVIMLVIALVVVGVEGFRNRAIR